VPRLRVVFGRKPGGLAWDAVDGQPVSYIFLLAAPPVEGSNDYLPVLGRIAELVKEPDVPNRLGQVTTAAEFLALLEEKKN
jgi:mannitol/fructose-specific phosphotransferase system IIA component (Ntr-type)